MNMSVFANSIAKSAVGRLPMPIFGTVATATLWARHSARSFPPGAAWGFPIIVGGFWFIWPAVDQEWKIEMGFMRDPAPPKPAPAEPKLDPVAQKAVAEAYLPPPEAAPTEKDIIIEKELKKGEFGTLESEWDTFLLKAIKPGEDDDDDDDEDDDDEDDEDEEDDE